MHFTGVNPDIVRIRPCIRAPNRRQVKARGERDGRLVSGRKTALNGVHIAPNGKPVLDLPGWEERRFHKAPLLSQQYSFGKLKLFSGSANPCLAQEIAHYLGLELGAIMTKRFADGEIYVQIQESIRGCDVFLIQPTCPPVNDSLMELLVMIDACRRASARSITPVIPYYGYARADRKNLGRESIAAKLTANLLTEAGAHRVLAMDLHSGQCIGYFDIPVDHIYGDVVLLDYLASKRIANGDLVVVSPDVGGVARARAFAKKLNDAPLAIVDKRRSAHNVSNVMNLIGDVDDKVAVLVDDMIDTAGTITNAAKALQENGAQEVYACATHAVFSPPAIERLSSGVFQEVIVTNTIPVQQQNLFPELTLLSVANLLGETIWRMSYSAFKSRLKVVVDANALRHAVDGMPAPEEKFRALLQRIGLQPSRTILIQAFRQDTAHVLTWIVENVTDAHIVHQLLRKDHNNLKGRLSLPLDPDAVATISEPETGIWDKSEEQLEEIELTLQKRLEERRQEITNLRNIAAILEQQKQKTMENSTYAAEENVVFVSRLLELSQHRASESGARLEQQCIAFSSAIDDYSETLRSYEKRLYFTQYQSETYWQHSNSLMQQIERMAKDVLPTQRATETAQNQLDILIQLSDLSACPWFLQLERNRQYKQVSDQRHIERLLAKSRARIRFKTIRHNAARFAQNGDAIGGLKSNEMSVEDLKTENKKLALIKKAVLQNEIPVLLAQRNRRIGMDMVREYLTPLCTEWCKFLLRKQEVLQLLCHQMDRNRVYTILGEIENTKIAELARYMKNLAKTFQSATAVARSRAEQYKANSQHFVDYIHPDDTHLHSIASLLKICSAVLEENEMMDDIDVKTSQQGRLKRQYSIAFQDSAETRKSTGLSPVSKLIKEQRQKPNQMALNDRVPTTPDELESGLRRLSVECDDVSKGMAEFRDSYSTEGTTTPVSLHNLTIQSNRILSLPSRTPTLLTRFFIDNLSRHLTSFTAVVDAARTLVFGPESDHVTLHTPSFETGLEGMDAVIDKLNELGGTMKKQFKSSLHRYKGQPEQARKRHDMEQFLSQ